MNKVRPGERQRRASPTRAQGNGLGARELRQWADHARGHFGQGALLVKLSPAPRAKPPRPQQAPPPRLAQGISLKGPKAVREGPLILTQGFPSVRGPGALALEPRINTTPPHMQTGGGWVQDPGTGVGFKSARVRNKRRASAAPPHMRAACGTAMQRGPACPQLAPHVAQALGTNQGTLGQWGQVGECTQEAGSHAGCMRALHAARAARNAPHAEKGWGVVLR